MWGWGRREVRSAPSQPSTHGTHNASAALLLVCSARREADLVTKYEIPEMVKRGKGAIVNNGSVTGLIGAPGAVANVSSKHGVTGLTKSAALQYATQGIRVNAVAPGNVRTPTFARFIAAHPAAEAAVLSTVPQGRWCESEEVADAVIFLCSAASHITGHVLPVDWGLDSALSLLECADL